MGWGSKYTRPTPARQRWISFRAAEYDVILLDINMRESEGVPGRVREIRRSLPRLEILMLTVRDSEEDKIAALDAGADDYITKPFHIRELAARIRAAVRRSSSFHSDLTR